MAHPVRIGFAATLAHGVVGEGATPWLLWRTYVVCHAVDCFWPPTTIDKDAQLRGAIPEHVENETLLEVAGINMLPPTAEDGTRQQRARGCAVSVPPQSLGHRPCAAPELARRTTAVEAVCGIPRCVKHSDALPVQGCLGRRKYPEEPGHPRRGLVPVAQ
eukprot:scaffold100737_cov75-Phaeocystis_antarctica.AAC.4